MFDPQAFGMTPTADDPKAFLDKLRAFSDASNVDPSGTTSTQSPADAVSAMFGIPNTQAAENTEAYKKLKEKLKSIKEREEKEKLDHYRPMEDSKGTFAMMLETTLDFFFLTPILFTDKSTGKPFFEPRRRDKARMFMIAEKKRLDEEMSRDGYGPPPSLSFLPTPEEMARERIQYVDSAANYLTLTRKGEVTDTRILERQPRPEESKDPQLIDVYKPRIPLGHVPITKEKYGSYDDAFRMCPIMASDGVGKGEMVCYIRLPGIYVHLPVYGLPKIVAGNLIYCIRKLYELFNVRLPAGVKWGDLVLRMEGSTRPLEMDEEVLIEDGDNGREDVADNMGDANEHRSTRIQMPNGDVPVILLESKEIVINGIVRGAPKPYVIRGIDMPDVTPETTKSAEVKSKPAKSSYSSDSGLRNRKHAASLTPEDEEEEESASASGHETESDEKSQLKPKSQAGSSSNDTGDDDEKESVEAGAEEMEEYNHLLKRKVPLDPDWQKRLMAYQPTRYNPRVKLDNFNRGFTVGDLKIALAEAAHLELTPEQAQSLPLWRRVPDLDPYARVYYVNDDGEEVWEEIPVDDVAEARSSGAKIEEIITTTAVSDSTETTARALVPSTTASLYHKSVETVVETAGPQPSTQVTEVKPKLFTAADMPPVSVLTKPRAQRNVLPAALATKIIAEFASSPQSDPGSTVDPDAPPYQKPRKERKQAKDGLRYKWEVVPYPNSTPLWVLDLDTCRHGPPTDENGTLNPTPESLATARPLSMNGNVFELHYNLQNVVEDELKRRRDAARKVVTEHSGRSRLAEGMLEVVGLTGGSSNPETAKLRERITKQILEKQKTALQKISYERAKAAGILDEHLKEMTARRLIAEQQGASSGQGLLSTRNLIFYAVVYIIGIVLYMYVRHTEEVREARFAQHSKFQTKMINEVYATQDPQGPKLGSLKDLNKLSASLEGMARNIEASDGSDSKKAKVGSATQGSASSNTEDATPTTTNKPPSMQEIAALIDQLKSIPGMKEKLDELLKEAQKGGR